MWIALNKFGVIIISVLNKLKWNEKNKIPSTSIKWRRTQFSILRFHHKFCHTVNCVSYYYYNRYAWMPKLLWQEHRALILAIFKSVCATITLIVRWESRKNAKTGVKGIAAYSQGNYKRSLWGVHIISLS